MTGAAIKQKLRDVSETADAVLVIYEEESASGSLNKSKFAQHVARLMQSQVEDAARVEELKELLEVLEAKQAELFTQLAADASNQEAYDAAIACRDLGMALANELVERMSFEAQASLLARIAPVLRRVLPLISAVL